MTKHDLHTTLLGFATGLELAARTFEEFSDIVERGEATDLDGEPLKQSIIHQLNYVQDETIKVLAAVWSIDD